MLILALNVFSTSFCQCGKFDCGSSFAFELQNCENWLFGAALQQCEDQQEGKNSDHSTAAVWTSGAGLMPKK